MQLGREGMAGPGPYTPCSYFEGIEVMGGRGWGLVTCRALPISLLPLLLQLSAAGLHRCTDEHGPRAAARLMRACLQHLHHQQQGDRLSSVELPICVVQTADSVSQEQATRALPSGRG